jgi:hypothetical protein
LTPAHICRSIFWTLHLSKFKSIWLSTPQALTSDHVVVTARSGRGHNVRRFTLGEEHDATGHEALTLLKCKVTAQGEVKGSC